MLVEAGAGAGSNFSDAEYVAAGARLAPNAAAVFECAELLCEVKEPQPSEYALLRQGQMLFTYLHLAAAEAVTDALLASGCTAIGYETVERDDGFLPLLAPMSEVAGRMAVEMAAQFLKKPGPGSGQLLGGLPGVPPAHVVVVGSGTVGKNACRARGGGGGAGHGALDQRGPTAQPGGAVHGPDRNGAGQRAERGPGGGRGRCRDRRGAGAGAPRPGRGDAGDGALHAQRAR